MTSDNDWTELATAQQARRVLKGRVALASLSGTDGYCVRVPQADVVELIRLGYCVRAYCSDVAADVVLLSIQEDRPV